MIAFKRHSLIYNCYVLLNTYHIKHNMEKVDLNRIRIIWTQILMNLMPWKVFSVSCITGNMPYLWCDNICFFLWNNYKLQVIVFSNSALKIMQISKNKLKRIKSIMKRTKTTLRFYHNAEHTHTRVRTRPIHIYIQ